MRLAYVTVDIHAWSGLGVHICSALQREGHQIKTIENLKYQWDYIYKTKEVLYSKMSSTRYRMLWDSILLKRFAAQVDSALASINPDVVFSLWTNPIAYARTEKPVVFWGDSTLAGLRERYPGYRNLCAETIRDGNKAEQLALTKCRLAIYSSEWAANTAVEYYNVDPAKVKVVPFGPNATCDRNIQAIQEIVKARGSDVCRLLFIGAEWIRKGGDIALEVASRLNRRGVRTELHIVGEGPSGEAPAFVKLHGFVSKASAEGRQHLNDLFSGAHFFIMPTRADCTPLVFPEASSFGLPILTTDVGGIRTAVRDGENGFAYPSDGDPEPYCDTIERLWSSRPEYEQLALSAFQEYSERLNWATAGRSISALIHEFCL